MDAEATAQLFTSCLVRHLETAVSRLPEPPCQRLSFLAAVLQHRYPAAHHSATGDRPANARLILLPAVPPAAAALKETLLICQPILFRLTSFG